MHSPSTWSQSSPMVGHGLTVNVTEEEPQNGLAKGLVLRAASMLYKGRDLRGGKQQWAEAIGEKISGNNEFRNYKKVKEFCM